MPFLPLYLEELGLTDVGEISLWAGFSLGVTPAITAFMAPLWGRLGDRYGRKVMVERSLVSFVVVMTAMAYVTRPWHVFALRAVQGLFAGYGALSLTMAADSAPKEQTAYAIGFVQTAQRLGPAVGPVIGGLVAQAVGLRKAFLVTAATYAVAAVLVAIVYDERAVVKTASAGSTGRVTFRDILAFENFVVLMVVIFGLQFVDRSFGPVLPLFVGALGESSGRVPLVAGLLFSVAAASAAIGNHLCGHLLRRGSARAVIASTCAVAAAGVGGYLFTANAWWLALPTAVFGAAIGAATTATYTAATTVIPMDARGAGFGLLTTASLVGLAVSPIVNGMLGATSIRAVFILDAIVLGALAILVSRVMITGVLPEPSSPSVEEI
ncbi:MAG: MFS transporter [Acidobacteria bacterium]|nr:MFS transporter [Acidobacteriota bacterium]